MVRHIQPIIVIPKKEIPQNNPLGKIPNEIVNQWNESFKKETQLSLSLKQIKFTDIENFFKTCGLVGEEKNACLIILCILHKKHLIISSQSGAGKSMLADTALLLFNEEDTYRLDFTSKQALMYDQFNFNKSTVIYASEIQKALAEQTNIDIIKSVTENRVVTRKVTRSSMPMSGGSVDWKAKNEMDKEGKSTHRVEELKIDGRNKVMITTLAIENEFKTDTELERRFITVYTDISEGQNKAVIESIGQTRFNKKRIKLMNQDEIQGIKNFCSNLLNIKDLDFINPFAPYLSKNMPTPSVKIRTHAKHYFDLIDAVTKFNYQERIKQDKKIFTTIQDCIKLYELYQEQFLLVINDIGLIGFDILNCFNENNVGYRKNKESKGEFISEYEHDRIYLTVTDIHNILKMNKDNKISVNHKVITDQCEKLIEGGFIEKEKTGTKTLYYRTVDDFEFQKDFNWSECYEDGLKLMQTEYPELLEQWKENNNIKELSRVIVEKKGLKRINKRDIQKVVKEIETIHEEYILNADEKLIMK